MAADTRGQISWALFQWARDCTGSLIVVFIYSPYFATEVVGDAVRGQVILGHINALAGIGTGFLGPIFGAIADTAGRRKPWIGLFVLFLLPTSFALWWSYPGGQGLGVFWTTVILVVFSMSFNFTDIFHSSMLPSVAPSNRIGYLSGLAGALGQASSVIVLCVVLYAFMLPGQVDWSFVPHEPLFGLDAAQYENSRITGPFSTLWLLAFSLPIFLFTPDTPRSNVTYRQSISVGLRRVYDTVRRLKHYKNVAIFLGARMCFNDGQVAILIFTSVYAAGVFKWRPLTLTCFGILISLVSIGTAIFGGKLADKIGSRGAIITGVTATMVGLLLAISITPTSLFFFFAFDPEHIPSSHLPIFRTLPEFIYLLIAVLTSASVYVVIASSRSMMAQIAPVSRISQFFGLYALSGTVTAFFGPELVATATSLSNSQRAGMASLLILLGLGIVGMIFVNDKRAEDAG